MIVKKWRKGYYRYFYCYIFSAVIVIKICIDQFVFAASFWKCSPTRCLQQELVFIYFHTNALPVLLYEYKAAIVFNIEKKNSKWKMLITFWCFSASANSVGASGGKMHQSTECVLCEFVLTKIDNYIEDNTTKVCTWWASYGEGVCTV